MRARSREDSTPDISVFCRERRGFRRRNSQSADSRTRKELLAGSIELCVEENGAADGAADPGEQEIRLPKAEARSNLLHESSKLARGVRQNFARRNVTGIGGRRHYWEERGKNVVRHGLRAMLHDGPFRAAKLRENLPAKNGIRSRFLVRLNGRGDGAAPDVKRAALIAARGAVASGPVGFLLRIASDGGGACSGDKHDSRPLACRGERGFQIRKDLDRGCGKANLQRQSHAPLHFRLGSSRKPRAYRRNGGPFESRFFEREAGRFHNRASRLFYADARRIRWARVGARENLVRRVHEHALGLSAAAIKA